MTRNTIKSLVLALAVLVAPVVNSVPAFAANEGQVEGGDIYRVRNVTDNTDFSDPASADKCETVQYKVRIHNPGPGSLSLVNVKATLPGGASTSNTSTVVVSSQNASPASTSDTATVNLSTAQSVAYISGSTQLLDAHNGFMSTLPDGITSSGVNIGAVGVSIEQKRYVQFSAKVDCPQPPTCATNPSLCPPPPPAPVYSCDLLSITADKDRNVKVSAFATTAKNGATFKDATLNWGDASATVTDANLIGKSHMYGKDGTYTVTATAHFTVTGDKDVTASGPNCSKSVTFKNDVPPVVTPPVTPPTPPATLVNTGAGSTIGLFALVSAIGAFMHRRYMSRRVLG